MSIMISSMRYHVAKPIVEPMLLRLVACGVGDIGVVDPTVFLG
jgi:hypothetical protein